MKLAIKDITVDPTIQIRRGNHEATVRRYEESFDKLPPVDVFKTTEGLLLADGFHRLAAAQRLGLREVTANIHKGTRDDALEFAVLGNTKNAEPLSEEERDDGIRRLKQLHGNWTQRQLAEAMSVSEQAIGRVFRAERVYRVLPNLPSPRGLVMEVASAKEEHWEPLLDAAEKRGWKRDETRLAVQNLKSDRIPDSHKRDLLAGRADPLAVDADGQFAIPTSAVGRKIKDLKERDALLILYRALEATGRLEHFDMAKLADAVAEDKKLPRVLKEVETSVAVWEELRSALRRVKSRKLEAIS